MQQFYAFNSPEAVEGHIAQIKTVADVQQLKRDIIASGTNLAKFTTGIEGVWAIDYAPKGCGKFYRHIFIAQSWLNNPANLPALPVVPTECKAYTIVSDG